MKNEMIEAFNNVTNLKFDVNFWVKEKAEALEAGDENRILDAIMELKGLERELALAELNMMYYFDILKMRNEIV